MNVKALFSSVYHWLNSTICKGFFRKRQRMSNIVSRRISSCFPKKVSGLNFMYGLDNFSFEIIFISKFTFCSRNWNSKDPILCFIKNVNNTWKSNFFHLCGVWHKSYAKCHGKLRKKKIQWLIFDFQQAILTCSFPNMADSFLRQPTKRLTVLSWCKVAKNQINVFWVSLGLQKKYSKIPPTGLRFA